MPLPEFVLIAANPRAGSQPRDRHLRELSEWLQSHGLTVEIVSELEPAERKATELFEQGRLRALVGAGGDGTLAELANRTVPGTPIAIYPSGTANLVARYVGASARCEEFGQMLLDRETVALDAGRANGRLFMAVCSCGFDAEVVRQVHDARTGHITALTYLMPILRTARSYRFPEMRLLCDCEIEQSSSEAAIAASWAFVSNLPCYAGGLKPGIGADGTDGQLDLCTFKKGGLLPALWYLPRLLLGNHEKLADCTRRRVRRVRIEANERVPYELDGDPGGVLPVEIDILPRRVTLVIPRAFTAAMSGSNLGS